MTKVPPLVEQKPIRSPLDEDRAEDAGSVAFFDLDETLVDTKSLGDFLAFFLVRTRGERGKAKFARRAYLLNSLAKLGFPRGFVNRVCYFFFINARAAEFDRLGEEWFAERRTRGGFFIEPALRALEAHQRAGVDICIVSGSSRAIVAPIARHLKVKNFLCAEQSAFAGRLTGWIDRPMIGEAKAEAAAKLLARRNIAPARCFAYGDHISDVPLLKCVGNAAVIVEATDERSALKELAELEGWRIIAVARH